VKQAVQLEKCLLPLSLA